MNDFDGTIDSNSVLTRITSTGRGIYGGSDVTVENGRYIIWSDVNTIDFAVLENFFTYLYEGCDPCDTEHECDGVECGVGSCGNACPDTCSSTDTCFDNTCSNFFTLPRSTSKWSIYHTGCIKWNIDGIYEPRGDIYLEYGLDTGSSHMKEIVSSFDLSLGEYEWMVYGCFPGTVRIVVVYSNSGKTQVSKEFKLHNPSSQISNSC